MKRKIMYTTTLITLMLLSSCNFLQDIEEKAAVINHYEKVALNTINDNRALRAEITRLNSNIEKLRTKNQFLTIKLKKKQDRSIASIAPLIPRGKDQINHDVYKWNPEQLLGMAENSFDKKNYEKSAQSFMTFRRNYPTDKRIDDRFLFQAGIAAFESNGHNDWVMENMTKLVADYPSSKFYRGAKLWMALTNLRKGDKDKFFQTVEEFRKKYRNTPEWKILSVRYEEIVQKYKK